MNKSKSSYLYIIICLSVIGVLLSYFLALEYYGNSDITSSLCSALGSEDSCAKVKESPYSAISLPVLGAVPIALFGFMFYGFIAVLGALSFKEPNDELHIPLLLGLSIIALLIDVVLFGISVGLIHAVCSLCFATYIVNAILISLFYIYMKKFFSEPIFNLLKKNFMTSFNKNFFTYLLIAVGSFTCGMWAAKTSTSSKYTKLASSQDVIQAKIAAYEKAPVVKIDLQNVPFAGDEKAPIVIVKFADFNCGHCMHASHILDAILAEFSGLVKVYYKNFPLDGHCNRLVQRKSPDASSCLAATSALCANKQKKFLPFYHALYRDNEMGIRHSPSSIAKIVQDLGMNLQAIQTCMSSSEIANYLSKEVDEGEMLNIQSTPSIFVNNRPLEPGTPEPNFLRELIKHISKKL